MRKFKLNKLIRDKVFDSMLDMKQRVDYKILNKTELIDALKEKLSEESLEFDPSSDEPLRELADLQEIIDTLVREMDFTKADLMKIQDLVREKRGGFQKKVFVDTVTLDDKDGWVKYYANDPEKFPEIKS